MKIQAVFAVASLLCTSVAYAMPITFDFTGGGPNARELSFTESGYTLVVSGERNFNPRRITWNNNGLGVDGSGSGQVNARRNNFEALNFALPHGALAWVGVEFWNLRRGESALVCSATGVGSQCESDTKVVRGRNRQNPQWVSLKGFSDLFDLAIFAERPHRGGFRIRSLTVDVRSVPEPAGLTVLAIAGFLGLMLLRRRRFHATQSGATAQK